MDFSIDIRIYEIGGCPGTRRLFHIRTDIRTVREIFHEHLHRVKFATCGLTCSRVNVNAYFHKDSCEHDLFLKNILLIS